MKYYLGGALQEWDSDILLGWSGNKGDNRLHSDSMGALWSQYHAWLKFKKKREIFQILNEWQDQNTAIIDSPC